MTKKVFVLFAISLLTTNVFAVPSVKKLGVASLSNNTSKPVANTQIRNADNKTNNKPMVAKTAKISASATPQGRIPGITGIKTINTAKIKPVATNNIVTKPTTSGVSEDKFNEVVERIDSLESQNQNAINEVAERIETLETKSENIITNVVENESGNYVTDVAVDGNKLNVNKTSLLYAPIRESDSDEISGNAEIWIVK